MVLDKYVEFRFLLVRLKEFRQETTIHILVVRDNIWKHC